MKRSIFLYTLLGLAMALLGQMVVMVLLGQYGMEEMVYGCMMYLVVMLFVCTGILRHTILHAGEKKQKKEEPAEEEEKPARKISQIDPFFRHYEKL